MKKTIIRLLSYVLVALVAASTTCVCFLYAQKNDTGKLEELENLLLQRFIGEADQDAMRMRRRLPWCLP